MKQREIKFRGKRSTTKKSEWVYGDLVRAESGMNYFIIPDTDLELADGNQTIFEQAYEVDPSTIGQYTGLKDKHGKEIYEGDVIEILYTDWPSQTDFSISHEEYLKSISNKGEVVFKDHQWEVKFYYLTGDEHYYGTFHVGTHGRIGEIIGSIHDKELKD